MFVMRMQRAATISMIALSILAGSGLVLGPAPAGAQTPQGPPRGQGSPTPTPVVVAPSPAGGQSRETCFDNVLRRYHDTIERAPEILDNLLREFCPESTSSNPPTNSPVTVTPTRTVTPPPPSQGGVTPTRTPTPPARTSRDACIAELTELYGPAALQDPRFLEIVMRERCPEALGSQSPASATSPTATVAPARDRAAATPAPSSGAGRERNRPN